MPAIFINPNTEEHINLLNRLKEQNQDLRVFISDKIEKEFIEKLRSVFFLLVMSFL